MMIPNQWKAVSHASAGLPWLRILLALGSTYRLVIWIPTANDRVFSGDNLVISDNPAVEYMKFFTDPIKARRYIRLKSVQYPIIKVTKDQTNKLPTISHFLFTPSATIPATGS